MAITKHIGSINSILFSLLFSELKKLFNIFKLIKLEYRKFGFSFMNLIIEGIKSLFISFIFLFDDFIMLYIISNIFDKVILF